MSGPAVIRLAAVAAGPVFYQAPLYRLVAADPRVELTVFFASSGGVRPYDAGFGGAQVTWDADLVGGYEHVFLDAADENEVVDGFLGLRDRDVFGRIRRGGFHALWVHGFSYLTLWFAIGAARATRVPVLIREEQTLLHERPWPKRWVREGILRALFAVSYGLYIGTRNRAYFERYGMPPQRLFFTPYCVDNDELRAAADRFAGERAELRREFGIESDAPVVLFVGRLEPKKDPLLALEAFARVRAERDCALLVVGDGSLLPTLRARVEASRIPDVHLAGFHNRAGVLRALAAADLLVLPSAFHETWGLVVNEAMNFALPVVVSDKVGCGPDLVRPGENGTVFPSRDAAALAAALGELVANSERRSRFGERSRELVTGWNYGVARDGIVAACAAAVGGTRQAA